MRLSAIVPATDLPPTLTRCVAALLGADEPPDELVVVEEALGPGPAAARNEGAARARGEVLLFVDSDVVVHADAIARVRRAFESDPGLAAIFGSYDDDPPAPGVVSGFRNLLHHHVHHAAAGRATTFWAGLGAMRRDVFEAIGGYDAARFPQASVEDIELGLRVSADGGRIRLDPAIRGTHLKAWTLTQMVHVDFARRGVPWAQLVLERGGSTALNLGWRHRLSAAASIAAVACACAGRRRGTAAALGTLLALNAGFYGLLLRRQGAAGAAAGVGLHVLHHLTGVAAAGTAAAGVIARQLSGEDA